MKANVTKINSIGDQTTVVYHRLKNGKNISFTLILKTSDLEAAVDKEVFLKDRIKEQQDAAFPATKSFNTLVKEYTIVD